MPLQNILRVVFVGAVFDFGGLYPRQPGKLDKPLQPV